MRALPLVLLTGCSLIIDGRTDDYQGACVDEQVEAEAALGVAKTCRQRCNPDADEEACTAECIADDSHASADCSDCYAAMAECARDECGNACELDRESECATCMCREGCAAAVLACTGLVVVDCDE